MSCRDAAPGPATVRKPVVVKPPTCIELIGPAPLPPAEDTAPAAKVDLAAVEALTAKVRADGRTGDVLALTAYADALVARVRDLEDPVWVGYRVSLEGWRAMVEEGCQ